MLTLKVKVSNRVLSLGRVGRYTGVSVLSQYLQWAIIVSQPILDMAIYRPTWFIEENMV